MILLLLNVVLLVLGCFMETLAIMIILVPILIPVLNQFQIDLTHFGIILLVNLTIGQLTPPVGVLLFVASSVAQGAAGPAGAGGGAVRRGADRGAAGHHLHSRPVPVAAAGAEVAAPTQDSHRSRPDLGRFLLQNPSLGHAVAPEQGTPVNEVRISRSIPGSCPP